MTKLVSRQLSVRGCAIAHTSLLIVILLGSSSQVVRATDFIRVLTEVDVKGKIKFNPAGRGVTSRSLAAQGGLRYDQKLDSSGSKAARFYFRAEGKSSVGNSTTKHGLRMSHRSVGVGHSDAGLTFISPAGLLTRDELDVLEVQFDPLFLNGLVPESRKQGAKAYPSNELLASLLVVDAIHESDVAAVVVESDASKAIITLKGKASGAVDGVSTAIEITGEMRLRLDSKTIERAEVTLKENRSIGHASPGLDVTATITTTISPITSSPYLTAKVLNSIDLTQSHDSQRLIAYRSTYAGIRLLLDERWKIMVDRPETLILRMVDHGDLVGQCNISRLSTLSAEDQPSLERFKSDVREALGDNFGQFLASSSTTKDGTSVLRVAATGTSSELAVNWVYYHLSNTSGRRVSLVFTSESELATRFAEADVALVASLRFEQSNRSSTRNDQADAGAEPSTRRE